MNKKHRESMRTHFILPLVAAVTATVMPACGDEPFHETSDEVAENLITPAELGLGDDWTELEPGLWSRGGADGGPEFIGIGEPGRLHALARLERVEEELLQLLAHEEREDTRAELEELDELITDLRTSEPPPQGPEVEPRCNPSISAGADAYTIPCGVAAKASASWSHCSYSGTVRSYAQAGCGYELVTHQCGPKSGKSVSCSSQTSITGPAPCRSFAWAEIAAPYTYVYVWDENTTRGSCNATPPPPSTEPCGGPCPAGKSCHCGDICRPVNTYCP